MADLVHRQIEDAPASSRPKTPTWPRRWWVATSNPNFIDIGLAVNWVLVAKSLDRITHHALNPAEYAMFEIEAIDLRRTQP
jgi:phosphate uptake regulator